MDQPQPAAEPLSPDAILIAEFEYVAQTAFQANEDRARVISFYLVTVGSFIAAILSSQVAAFQVLQVYWAFAALFAVLSLASVLTLLQLARLRQAWLDSAAAMNQIKDFYQRHVQGIPLEDAFRWKTSTLPARLKPWSISFLQALQVALLGGAAAGAAVIFAGLGFGVWWWEAAIGVGVVVLVLQVILYRQLLRR